MTVQEALDALEALKPHPYAPEHLLRELQRLDGRIQREVHAGREGGGDPLPAYTLDGAAEQALRVPEPYDLLYIHYLMAQVALWNGEMERYNQYAQLFAEVYGAYRADVSRSAPFTAGQKLRV